MGRAGGPKDARVATFASRIISQLPNHPEPKRKDSRKKKKTYLENPHDGPRQHNSVKLKLDVVLMKDCRRLKGVVVLSG